LTQHRCVCTKAPTEVGEFRICTEFKSVSWLLQVDPVRVSMQCHMRGTTGCCMCVVTRKCALWS